MTFGFDTNIFIYSFDRTDPGKHVKAKRLISAMLDRATAVPMQVISETLNAAHKKRHLIAPDARIACEALADLVHIEPATPDDAVAASRLAEDRKLQFFDAQLIKTQARLGVTVLLTEDLQSGQRFGTLQVLNPFTPGGNDMIDSLLTPQS